MKLSRVKKNTVNLKDFFWNLFDGESNANKIATGIMLELLFVIAIVMFVTFLLNLTLL